MGSQDLSGLPAAMSGVGSGVTTSAAVCWPASRESVVEGAESRLRHNSYLALKNVRCDYHEGVLTLRGCLPTYYLKQIAQSAVSQVEGVKRIVNEIEVVASARR